MNPVIYTPKRAAQLLGLDAKALAERAPQETYTAEDVRALRADLGQAPQRTQARKQLFLNFKGGTGKTTLSTSYAFRLAEKGYRVLLIDLDSQGHATKCVGVEDDTFTLTLCDVLIQKRPAREAIISTGYPGFDLIPSNLEMSAIDLSLMPLPGREFRMRNALKPIEAGYDFIVMDAPPSFGLLNLNALMTTDDLVIPVLGDFLSFHGLKLLFDTLQDLQTDLQLALGGVFIVINSFNASFKLAKEAQAALQAHYGDYLCRSLIRQSTQFAQASSEGLPISLIAPDSKGALDLEALIEELLARIALAPASSSM